MIKRLERRGFVGVLLVLLCVATLVSVLDWLAPGGWAIGGLVGLSVVVAGLAARRIRAELTRLFAHEDRLVRSIAHEIRRPLQRVIASADLGSAGVIPADEALDDTARHATMLSELFDDLVEAAQMLSGTRSLLRTDVEVAALVAEAEEMLGSAQITVTLKGGPSSAVVNPHLVRLAVLNLLRNAAVHGYSGGPGTVTVVLRDSGLVMNDRGTGFDEVALARLRREMPHSLRRSGSGVGLSLSAWVADIHGGHLTVDNRAGGGATVGLSWDTPRRATS